jgi:hypothetical protein
MLTFAAVPTRLARTKTPGSIPNAQGTRMSRYGRPTNMKRATTRPVGPNQVRLGRGAATRAAVATVLRWASAIAVSTVCSWAQAQPPSAPNPQSSAAAPQGPSVSAEPTEADRDRARDLLQKGRKLRDEKNHKGALDSFTQAHAIMGVPSTGLELAQTQADLQMFVEARRTLRTVIDYPQHPDEPEVFKNAREAASRLDTVLSDRMPKLRIKCRPQAAAACSASVDGQPALRIAADTYVEVNPGRHEVVLSVGGQRQATQVEVFEHQVKDVALQSVGGPQSTAPLPLPAATSSAQPQTQAGAMRPLSILALGLGGAGLAFGAITGIMAHSTVSDLRDKCPDNACPPEESDNIDRAHNLATMSTIGFVAGGVLAAAGIAGLLIDSPRAEAAPTAIAVRPWVGLNSVGTRVDF